MHVTVSGLKTIGFGFTALIVFTSLAYLCFMRLQEYFQLRKFKKEEKENVSVTLVYVNGQPCPKCKTNKLLVTTRRMGALVQPLSYDNVECPDCGRIATQQPSQSVGSDYVDEPWRS